MSIKALRRTQPSRLRLQATRPVGRVVELRSLGRTLEWQMSSEILKRIADGRTDLVFQYLSEGHSRSRPITRARRSLPYAPTMATLAP